MYHERLLAETEKKSHQTSKCSGLARTELIHIFFFFFQAEDGIRDVAVTGVQTCALPISSASQGASATSRLHTIPSNARLTTNQLRYTVACTIIVAISHLTLEKSAKPTRTDRKSTRLNSSHGYISYAVFCLKKKKRDPLAPGGKRRGRPVPPLSHVQYRRDRARCGRRAGTRTGPTPVDP